MKKSGIIAAASVAAASATAVSKPSCFSSKFQFNQQDSFQIKNEENSASNGGASSSDKFAPRFDGLRFIETLVTAHR